MLEAEQQMDTHRYAVLIKKPARDKLAGLSRHDKYHLLKDHSIQTVDRLLHWLSERNLRSQVKRVGPPTMFNTVFLDTTERVSQILSENPDVLSVAEAPDLDADLAI